MCARVSSILDTNRSGVDSTIPLCSLGADEKILESTILSGWVSGMNTDAIFRPSSIGRHAMVVATIPRMMNVTTMMEDDAMLSSDWTEIGDGYVVGDGLVPSFAARASIRNLGCGEERGVRYVSKYNLSVII